MGTQQLLSQAGAPTLLACDSGRDSAWVQRMDEDLLQGADALEQRFAEENVGQFADFVCFEFRVPFRVVHRYIKVDIEALIILLPQMKR